jgi:hypothetical protein
MSRIRDIGADIEPLFAKPLTRTKRFIEAESRHKGCSLSMAIDELMDELQTLRSRAIAAISARDSGHKLQ